MDDLRGFIKRVNETAKGELSIKYLGGPEVIPGFNQAMAVKSGVVDIAYLPMTYYQGLVAGGEIPMLSRLTAQEERQRGAYNFLLDLHKKGGLFYLGRRSLGMADQFLIFTNKKVARPQELAGQMLGKGTIAVAFLQKIGAISITIPDQEVYTALERKTIDGVIYAVATIANGGMQEVVRYAIEPGFMTSNVVFIMSLNKWNSLPNDLQKILMDAMIWQEGQCPTQNAKQTEKAWDKLLTGGVQKIKFSTDDEKWFIEALYRAEWDAAIKKYPDIGPQLEKLLSK